MRRALILATCTVTAVVLPALGSARPLPGAPACPIFPADNPWNQRVDGLPVDKNSAGLIAR